MKETKDRENINLHDQIQDLSKKIAETHTQGVLTAESLTGLIRTEENRQNQLQDRFKEVEAELDTEIRKATEKHERWLMQVEDYRKELCSVSADRQIAEVAVKANAESLSALKIEKSKHETLDEQIEMSMELLSEAMDYFSHSKEHIHFNSSFCDVLKQLRKSTFEAIEAEKNFEFQATKDPRELLPYTRKS
mmetsp:Transcript_923/g.2158  ORF Transcript_923/g.2158 Transcript_923/m.2158 type:complete len:192 (-) Transcript_923:5353-5928(-)